MRLKNVAISVVAEETGYNTSAGAGAYMGMGPAIRVRGQHFVIDSVSVTHSGDCGLNVAGALKLMNTLDKQVAFKGRVQKNNIEFFILKEDGTSIKAKEEIPFEITPAIKSNIVNLNF